MDLSNRKCKSSVEISKNFPWWYFI